MKNKNVWILHHYATPPTFNGFTRPYNLAVNLKEDRFNVNVFAASYLHFADKNIINDSILYKMNNDTEIPHVFIRTKIAANSGIKRIFNMIEFYKNLLCTSKSIIRDIGKPDIIIASSPHPLTMIAGIKIAKSLNIPCICEVRDFWPEVFFTGGKLKENSLLGKLLLKGEYWIYKKSDALIFLKEGDINYLKDKQWDKLSGGDIDLKKCFYLNNGVDLKAFDHSVSINQINDVDLNSDKFKIIYAGAIRPVNNVSNILDAANKLKHLPDIEFLIYGEGNQLEYLRKRLIDEGIQNVKLKGYIEKKYIPYVLSKADINLLNYSQTQYNWSRGNSSNKLFEYMASGHPIISSVKVGYCLLERYKCGLSLKQDNPESLAEAVNKLYNMNSESLDLMSRNARLAALDYDYKKLGRELSLILKNVMEEHND